MAQGKLTPSLVRQFQQSGFDSLTNSIQVRTVLLASVGGQSYANARVCFKAHGPLPDRLRLPMDVTPCKLFPSLPPLHGRFRTLAAPDFAHVLLVHNQPCCASNCTASQRDPIRHADRVRNIAELKYQSRLTSKGVQQPQPMARRQPTSVLMLSIKGLAPDWRQQSVEISMVEWQRQRHSTCRNE